MSFTITVAPSGHQFQAEQGEPILDAAIRQGVMLPYGCRGGRCGACVAPLLSGAVSYPGDILPMALGEQADGKCAPCAALAESDLTIEVQEIPSAKEIEIKTLPCRVQQIDHLCHDVVRLKLKLPENQRLQFMAGQYLEFLLADGKRRAFSMANAPHDDQFIELHIRHVDGGVFTDWVFEKMQDKTILRIEAPHGSFVLDEDSDRPMVFVGGGTGFAPLKAQIEHAFELGIQRPMTLYWGVRSERDLYLPDLPVEWAAKHANFQFIPVLSEPDADWQGRNGWVHEAVVQDLPNLAEHDIYMAGPPVMVQAGRDAFRAVGVADAQMHYDSFEYAAQTEADKG